MAIVQYQVMYRYVHPITRIPCTNLTGEVYDDSKRFIKGYGTADALDQTKDMMEESDARNPKYDMLFVYNGLIPINDYMEGKTHINAQSTILSESFVRCKGEGWFVASTHASLQSALKSADPLVRSLGRENVKVAKMVPLEITVGLE